MEAREEKIFSLAHHITYVTKIVDRNYRDILEEYLGYNVYDFRDFMSDYNKVPSSEYKCIILFMCMLYFDKGEHPYFMRINRDTQRTEYLLSEVVDDPFDMDEATTFQIDFKPKVVYRKQGFNYTGFFVEEYCPKESIKTTIYDVNAIKDAACTTHGEPTPKEVMNKEFESPSFCSYSGVILTISVKPLIDIRSTVYGYEIEEIDSKGVSTKTSITGEKLKMGATMYSVYYDYMIEKGYFFGSGEKSSNIKIKK